jgi:hypothetical protein
MGAPQEHRELEAKNVEIDLPEVAGDREPVDPDLRVALYIPSDLEDRDPHLIHVAFGENILKAHATDFEVSRVEIPPSAAWSRAQNLKLELAKPFLERLSELVRGLFPQVTVIRQQSTSVPYDLLLRADLDPHFLWYTDGRPGLQGIDVRITLTGYDAEGKTLDVVQAAGKGLAKEKHLYWSATTGWRAIATEAMVNAFKDLLNKLSDKKPGIHLRKLTEPKAPPAELAVVARFDDSSAVFANGQLDAAEIAHLVVEVSNQGRGTAYGVVVHVTCEDCPEVEVSQDTSVGDLAPGEKREVVSPVSSGPDVSSTVAKLRIETSERRGYGARPILFELPTVQMVSPKLDIVDVTLNDRSGRAKGDGDGQPGNGEIIEAVVRVRNAGPGEAAGVSVALVARKGGAEILDPKVILPRIAANGVGEARLLFRLPITLQDSELTLAFRAEDVRGAEIGAATKEQSWKLHLKHPGIELAYRLYDGNSAGSAGNRDGKANNGERIEVAVTPTNRGDLPARQVRIMVEPDEAKLVPQPAVLEVGDLPAQAEGAAQRFLFDVPRGFGLERPEKDLHFTLVISQQDFPTHKESVSLTFHALRPGFALEADAPSLAKGAGGEMVLRLRNTGALRAEDVTIEASSDTSGIDLLDERGVPVRSRKIAVGTLDPGSTAPVLSVGIKIRRNAEAGLAPVLMTLSQKDFPPLFKTLQVAVIEETASVITVPRSEEQAPRPASVLTPSAPATISFLQNTPGQHLLAEAVILRFEVQAPAEVAEVRLTQNERLLPLEVARRTESAAGGLRVAQYELPVQLAEGENHFEVVAVTRQGLRSARSLTLIRDREVGRLWVVAIGVSKYQDQAIPHLGYADADARAVYSYYRDTLGVPEEQVFLRINEQATLREIKSLVGTRLVSLASDPRDTVIVYFAGHGMREHSPGSVDADGLGKYFLPFDTSSSDLFSTALEMDEMTNILRRLTPERVVVILDSCFSGAAGSRSFSSPKTRALSSREFLERMTTAGKGRIVLAASEPDKAAQEDSDLGHGVFTYYLLEGLRGAADRDNDGDITLQEAFDYVSEKLARVTKPQQKPMKYEPEGSVGKIILGRGAVHPRR